MRGKILLLAGFALTAPCSFTPMPAQAHGDIVAVKEGYMPGTIVIRTGERRLYLLCRDRRGDPLSGRRRARRHAMGGHRSY